MHCITSSGESLCHAVERVMYFIASHVRASFSFIAIFACVCVRVCEGEKGVKFYQRNIVITCEVWGKEFFANIHCVCMFW